MQRAPRAVGLLFGLSLAVLITLVGPLLLFNPPFVFALQDRQAVAERSFDGMNDPVDSATLSIVLDVWTDGAFDVDLPGGTPLLDQRERSHMHDVAVLVRVLFAIVVLALVIAGITAVLLRREPGRQGWIMVLTGGIMGGVAIGLAGIFAVAFEPAFLVFHQIFFPPGTYLFEPGSKLIALFPQGFWFEAAIVAGAAIVLSALLVVLIGLRLWQRPPPATLRPA